MGTQKQLKINTNGTKKKRYKWKNKNILKIISKL